MFQSTLINYVKLLNQLPRSLSAMMKGTGPASSNLMWISEGEKLNEVLAITLNSLQNCLTDPSCPISLEASLFSYQWPKKEQLKSFTPNSSPSAPSVVSYFPLFLLFFSCFIMIGNGFYYFRNSRSGSVSFRRMRS